MRAAGLHASHVPSMGEDEEEPGRGAPVRRLERVLLQAATMRQVLPATQPAAQQELRPPRTVNNYLFSASNKLFHPSFVKSQLITIVKRLRQL